MKQKLEAVSWPYRLLIILGLFYITTIFTSYSIYANQQQEIEKNLRVKQDTKQEIRTFVESVEPEILQRIDKGSTKIITKLKASKLVELVGLSKQPGFDKYLSFEHFNSKKDGWDDFGDPNINTFIEKDKFFDWMEVYYLYPKDALIK